MIAWATRTIAAWSVRTYPFLVQAYPDAFRREFGESMTQAFCDLARDACRTSGLVGLAVLWMRTLGDFVVSLVEVYASERREAMSRVVLATCLLYLAVLAVAVGYGATRFGEFYEPPAFSRFGAGSSADENVLLAGYERALAGRFGEYKRFATGAGLVIALLLGVASAVFGLWQKSLLHGAAAFAAGSVLTIGAVSLLPTIWFPLDRYPVGFVWLIGSFPAAAAVWLLVTAAGWFWPLRPSIDATGSNAPIRRSS